MGLEKVKNLIKSKIDPEKYVEERIPFLGKLNLSRVTVDWICDVKRVSEKQLEKQQSWERKAKKKEVQIKPMAFDLVELYLRVLKDQKDSGDPHFISESSEKKLDWILACIVNGYPEDFLDQEKRDWMLLHRKYHPEFSMKEYRNMELKPYEIDELQCFDKLPQAKNAEEKMGVLDRFLNIWHTGGTNITLEYTLGGFPTKGFDSLSQAAKHFLYNLNILREK